MGDDGKGVAEREQGKKTQIRHHRDLLVWQEAKSTAMQIFRLTKCFPPEEKYSMTDQIRRSSRSVAANISEAWAKRRYKAAFILKLNDAMSEAAETETWLDFALECGYIAQDTHAELCQCYARIIGRLITMTQRPEDWIIKSQ
jgi:four helix bundle protein